MTVVIADEVTRVWPTTEAALIADPVVGYDDQKTLAIARAKVALYGSAAVPALEDDIPDLAKYWIADKAVVLLIPTARDYYMKQRISDSKEGASITYYNKLQALGELRTELEASMASDLAGAQAAIESSDSTASDTPAVSVNGMMLDPAVRAYNRGIPGGGGQYPVRWTR